MKHRLLRTLLPLVLAAAMLSGCGGNKTATEAPASGGSAAPASIPAVTTPATPGDTGAGQAGSGSEEGDPFIHVKSIEDLIAAIEPGAQIMIEPGRYNVWDFLKGFPNVRDMDAWNEEHEYVHISPVYDGAELVIINVDGLTITGGSDDPAATELVTDPRYASVLYFENCSDISLGCLTLGHTDTGDCSGNVIDLYETQNFYVRSCDLYGCGVYGIGAYENSGNLYVSNSTIRDCEFGPFDIYSGVGEFTFTACTFDGSGWGGYFEENASSKLKFVGCSFGQNESNVWYFEDRYCEDCEFMEPTEYPEYGYDDYDEEDYEYEYVPPRFEPETMTQVDMGAYGMEETYWIGKFQISKQSGETTELGYYGVDDADIINVYLDFEDDGTGVFTYDDVEYPGKWELMNDEQGVFTLDGGENIYFSLMKQPDESPEDDVEAGFMYWLMVDYRNDTLWFY